MRSLAVIALVVVTTVAVVLAQGGGGQTTLPLPYTQWAGQRVLMVSAHPDDIEACAGGLVTLLAAQSTEVYFLIITNGDKGCGNPAMCGNWTSAQIAVERATEAVNAARVMGVDPSHVTLLDYEDGMVTSYEEAVLRRDIIQSIRSIQPQVVMSWVPLPNYQLMPSQNWADLGFHVRCRCATLMAPYVI